MFSKAPWILLPLCVWATLTAQDRGEPDYVVRTTPGISPPQVLKKVEPEYSHDARVNHVQGTVILQCVVNEQGRAAGITVLSPLGFGLDERAQQAIEKWEFAPATKGGQPVKFLATIEVHFRFQGIWFDSKIEQQRTSYNVAIQAFKKPRPTLKEIERAVKTILDLSAQRFPAAMYLAGSWAVNGEHIPKNESEGLALIEKAAAKSFGPALYEIAIRRIQGRDFPKDVEKGLDGMREAAMLGSSQAQFYLGALYENGGVAPRELDRARRYFRLCAARGIALCQYRLGRLLFDAPDRRERDYVQAIAWFQLAGEQGLSEAKEASAESARLTESQTALVNTLKSQLVRK